MGSFISVRLLYSFLTHKNKIKSSPLICCAGGRWCINPSGSEQPAHSVDARILMIWQESEYRRRDKPLQHFKRSQWVLIFPLQGPPYADTLFLAQFLAMTAWHFERQIRQLTCCRKIEEKKSCLCAASTFFFYPGMSVWQHRSLWHGHTTPRSRVDALHYFSNKQDLCKRCPNVHQMAVSANAQLGPAFPIQKTTCIMTIFADQKPEDQTVVWRQMLWHLFSAPALKARDLWPNCQ